MIVSYSQSVFNYKTKKRASFTADTLSMGKILDRMLAKHPLVNGLTRSELIGYIDLAGKHQKATMEWKNAGMPDDKNSLTKEAVDLLRYRLEKERGFNQRNIPIEHYYQKYLATRDSIYLDSLEQGK